MTDVAPHSVVTEINLKRGEGLKTDPYFMRMRIYTYDKIFKEVFILTIYQEGAFECDQLFRSVSPASFTPPFFFLGAGGGEDVKELYQKFVFICEIIFF